MNKFRKISLFVLLILVSSVYIYTASGPAILDDGDALYSHIAQQMVERRDWVTPYANGVRFFDKPPLMYWLMALSYEALGRSEFTVRLPSALAVLGTALLLYSLGKRTCDSFSGFIAGIASALCVGTFLFTRMVFPDILFVFLLTVAVGSFLEWYLSPENAVLPALLFYVSLAGAVLAKGLIGVLFPVAIVLLFLTRERTWRRLRHFHLWKGIVLFVVLAVPWHLLAARRNPGFLWHFFINEQVLRFLGRRQPMDYESISLPIFWLLILLWFFPWTAFLPAIRHLFPLSRHRRPETRAVVWLSLSWIIVVLGFFSLSSRIEHYSLPLLPPLALLAGIALSPENLTDAALDQRRNRALARGWISLGVLGGILGLVALVVMGAWAAGWLQGGTLQTVAGGHAQAYKHYFAPLFDFPPEILSRLAHPVVVTSVLFSVGLLSAWRMDRRGWRIPAVLVLSGVMIGFCLNAFQSHRFCEEVLSSKHFGQTLAQLYRSGDFFIVAGDFETANSLNFYAPIQLNIYGGRAAVLELGLRYPDAPKLILSREDLDTRWRSTQRVFLISPDSRIADLGLDHSYPVLHSAGRTLLCNQPIFE